LSLKDIHRAGRYVGGVVWVAGGLAVASAENCKRLTSGAVGDPACGCRTGRDSSFVLVFLCFFSSASPRRHLSRSGKRYVAEASDHRLLARTLGASSCWSFSDTDSDMRSRVDASSRSASLHEVRVTGARRGLEDPRRPWLHIYLSAPRFRTIAAVARPHIPLLSSIPPVVFSVAFGCCILSSGFTSRSGSIPSRTLAQPPSTSAASLAAIPPGTSPQHPPYL